MLDGRRVRSVLLLLVLLAPVALAATPKADLPAAFSMDAQDVTGLGVDPTGQYVGVGVAFDPAKLPTIPVGGTTTTHRDVYVCNFGPVETPGAGARCNGYRHPSSVSGTLNAPQVVDATSFDVTGGRTARFAVAGPGPTVSLWTNTGSTAEWTRQVEGTNQQAINVSISRDASRVAFLVAPATGPGSLQLRFGGNGTVVWDIGLTGLNGASVRPTSIEYARSGDVLAVGTADTGGVLLFNPAGDRPSGTPAGISQTTDVNTVVLSDDGNHLVAAAANGMFYAKLTRSAGKPALATQVYSNTFGTGVQDAAITNDGARFAAAVGSDLYFYRTLNDSNLAAPFGEKHALGARISDLDYDDKGRLLVAIAGNTVYGFGPARTTPIFSFDATQTAFGALDGPLRSVSVSDDGQRIVVAGKTKVMSYSSVEAVDAKLRSVTGATSLQPTQTLELALNVTNTGSLPDTYTPVVEMPNEKWARPSLATLTLDPGQSGEVRFNVTAPGNSAAGSYGVKVSLRSAVVDEVARQQNTNPDYIAAPSFNFTIPRSVILKVEAPDDRLLLRVGGEQTVAFTIRNEGNSEGVVNLSVRQEVTRGASWDVRFAQEQVRVPAGGSAQATMVVTAPSDAGSGDRNIITIRAREGETIEATDQITAYAGAEFGVELRVSNTTLEFYPGQFRTVTMTVTNTGNTEDTFNLTSALTPSSIANDWRVTIETPQVTIARGQSRTVAVTIKPAIAEARDASLTLSAISQSAPDNEETSVILNLIAVEKPIEEEKDDRLLPAPGAALVVLVALGLAAARRRGGSR